MPKSKPPPESAPPRKRRRRSRPIPKWLKEQQDLDQIARRRTLLVLSVLSGEKPVTSAIEEVGISRQLYYQLEEKALRAMLRALNPATTASDIPAAGAVKRAQELESKVQQLEAAKRRSERLLLLTQKLVSPGPMKAGPGRRPGSRNKAKDSASSSGSSATSSSPKPETSTPAASTRTKVGGGER